MANYTALIDLNPQVDWIRPLADRPLISYPLRTLENNSPCAAILVISSLPAVGRVVTQLSLAKVRLVSRRVTAAGQLDMTATLKSANLAADATVLLLDGLAVLIRSTMLTAAFDDYLRHVAPGTLAAERGFRISTVAELEKPSGQDFRWWPLPKVATLHPVGAEETTAVEAVLHHRRRRETNPVKTRRIRLFLTDVDGTLTDSGMYYSEAGDELKKFNTRDGKGLQLLQQAGIQVGIITGENRELVRRRSQKLGLDHLFLGIADKVPVVRALLEELGLTWSEVAFIGDDVNDTELLEKVGYSAVPRDAIRRNRELADYVCRRKGGEGCVREFAELLLAGGNGDY